MQGLKDLFDSDRGVICLLLIVIAAAFVFVGKMSIDEWIKFAQIVGIAFIGGHTITGVAETVMAGKPAESVPK